jgi:Mrp family chromosome partitioning ATPase
MTNEIDRKTTALIKHEVFNPLARFTSGKRQGRLLLKTLRRSLDDPEAAYAVQHLRDQIFFHPLEQGKGGKVVGISGARGNEGSTSIGILLGLTLGELKRNRVVFIDGRMERQNFTLYTEMFGLTKNALSYNNGCGSFQCYNTKNRNLCFLAPGGAVDSLEIFSNTEFSHLVGDLREAFDYVVFDMPPVLGSSETRMLLPSLDLFFLVCVPRKTTFAEVEKCKKTVAAAGGSISGVILNKQKAPFWTLLFGKDAFY